MSKKVERLLREERWKQWASASNIFLLEAAGDDEPTKVIRQNPGDTDTTKIVPAPAASNTGRRPVDPQKDVGNAPEGEETGTGAAFSDPKGGLTEPGKAALKANTIWTNHLTQLHSFQLGKQIAAQIGQKLGDQLGFEPAVGEKIADAVMKQVLEHLDEVATSEMEKTFPGVFDRTRS